MKRGFEYSIEFLMILLLALLLGIIFFSLISGRLKDVFLPK